MSVPYTFASATGSIPLSQLDSNFNTPITIGNTAVLLGGSITTAYNMTFGNVIITSVGSTFPNNYLGNSNVVIGTTTIPLGNTATTLDGVTLANVTISTGNVTITNIAVTTANVTTANITNAFIGTANVTTANLTTAAIGTANITTANVTTANVTTGSVTTLNATYANIATALRTQALTGYLYGNANTGNVSAATTIPNNGLANSTATLGNATITLGSTTTSVGNLTLTNVSVTSVSTPITITQGGTGNTSFLLANIATYTGTETLTNKRIDPRVASTTTATTLTPSVATADIYAYTALASALTINAPGGTPVDGDKLLFRILDNGTSRVITWNATFTSMVGTSFTNSFSTTANKTSYFGCVYNASGTPRWDVIAVTTQA